VRACYLAPDVPGLVLSESTPVDREVALGCRRLRRASGLRRERELRGAPARSLSPNHAAPRYEWHWFDRVAHDKVLFDGEMALLDPAEERGIAFGRDVS